MNNVKAMGFLGGFVVLSLCASIIGVLIAVAFVSFDLFMRMYYAVLG